MPSLLAVDLGLKTGLALYGGDGRLQWYRSTNFGSRTRLKRGVYGVLADIRGLAHVVCEGDRRLYEVWAKAARKQGAATRLVQAAQWRQRLLYAREHRSGSDAKQNADVLARRVIDWSGAARPTSSLRHDAAEAILIGLWAVLELEWLPDLPPGVR